MSTAVSSHSGAGPLSLMSCVRESSPPQDSVHEYEIEKNVGSKKKFWNPRKWFRRKHNKVSEEVTSSNEVKEQTLRSRSTSELSVDEDQTRRRSGTPMHPGLSVSHDSVFHSPHSGSELELDGAQSSSSLSISHHQPTQPDIRLQTELSERLRLRRVRGDTSEDDEGLPHSPCNSPTTTDGCLFKTNNKDHPTKSHSTCSDGSLLSMGSSEMDEDSFGQHSRHSSKISLHEKRIQDVSDTEFEWGPGHSSAPLNHSAAHHKVAVRPKRTHGAPRRKRGPGAVSALPTTPEVNEESSIRSLSPDATTRETLNELYTSMSQAQSQTITDSKLKCSSLPPGLAGPGGDNSKLSRSRSNAGSKSQDPFSTLEEEEDGDEKKDSSFFGRFFPRRSAKKKKLKEEKREAERTIVNITANNAYTKTESNSYYSSINYVTLDPSDRRINIDSNLAIRPNALIRSGPASRQRMLPIDIPASPDLPRREDAVDKIPSTSPLQIELENRFKNRMTMPIPIPSSPPKIHYDSPPISPKQPLHFSMSPPKSPWSEKRHYTKYSSSKFIESTNKETSKFEESKSKVRIGGLSSLQQRVLSLNDDTDNGFKSLTNLPTDYEKPVKPVAKSHSFKSTKTNFNTNDIRHTYMPIFKTNESEKQETSMFKSVSLDSVQNLEANIVESINQSKIDAKIMIDKVTVNKASDDKISIDNYKNIKSPDMFSRISETLLNVEKSPEFIRRSIVNDVMEKSSEVVTRREVSETFLNAEITPEILRRSNTSETFLSLEQPDLLPKIEIKNPDVADDNITISGPSHKAIVNVGTTELRSSITLAQTVDASDNLKEIKEQQISITKIQVKRESTQVTLTKNAIPEFFNIQLNKVVDVNPLNVKILNSPKDEQQFNFEESDFKIPQFETVDCKRKFSNDNIEVIKKDDLIESKHMVTVTPIMAPPVNRFYKKHSIVSISPEKEKPMLRIKSNSFDSSEQKRSGEVSPTSNKSSQNSLDKIETKSQENLSENVILRRKSMIKHNKGDDEPELMKVFARRSLKLKDSDSEIISQQVMLMVEENESNMSKSRDSDKENVSSDSSPIEERKKTVLKDKKDIIIPPKNKDLIIPPKNRDIILQNNLEIISQKAKEYKEILPQKHKEIISQKNKEIIPPKIIKEPLTETKYVESTEVILRKPIVNNKFSMYQQRTASIPQKNNNDMKVLQKQISVERPKTENWFNKSQEDAREVEKIEVEEIISNISEKSDIITEINNKPKNFNQRKAEWEKRAQEALRKTLP